MRTAKALVDELRARKGSAAPALSVVHGLAATYLVERDDVTTADLARHLRMTKQSASEIVSALEDAGIVRRVPHPTDGRARAVRLTAAGRRRLEASAASRRQLEAEWAALVGDDRLAEVRRALEAYLAAGERADGQLASKTS